MSGIESRCEVSWERPANMYELKRNHIQVTKENRKLFKGQSHILFIFKPVTVSYVKHIEDLDKRNFKQCKQYDYCLYVPSVTGHVGGCYWNQSTEISTVKRKLKRMIGHLDVIKLEITEEELNVDADNYLHHLKNLYSRYHCLKIADTCNSRGKNNDGFKIFYEIAHVFESCALDFRLDYVNLCFDNLVFDKLNKFLFTGFLRVTSRYKKHIRRWEELYNCAVTNIPDYKHALRGLKSE